jgi:hypothetical protein
MPPPLSDGQVTYTDGSPQTVAQYAKDVTAFLAWAAEPHLEARKRLGFQVMIFLFVLAGLLYLTKKKVWDEVEKPREIAHGLSIVHTAGVVDRDRKAGNRMLRVDDTVALIDFGISRSALVANAPADGSSEIAGTPYYMSPEQASGAPTDERTDLYALGVILYQLLTGEKPYVGSTTEEILALHREAPLPELPAALGAYQPLLNKLLAKDPAQRYGNAREVLEALETLPAPSREAEVIPLAVG